MHLRVLIIDDEQDICSLLSKILLKRGIEVNSVHSLKEAKASLDTFSPSVIFLDNHLPDGLGEEFICHLNTHYPQVKVIFITGMEIDSDKIRSKGALDVIPKPFTTDRIFSAIEKYA